MKKILNIAILGHGAIAGYVLDQIQSETKVRVSAIIARASSMERAKIFAKDICPVITASDQLESDVNLVVDCAGHEGLIAHGEGILSAGMDLITISTGAFADSEVFNRLEKAAIEGNSRLKLLPGAIGGIDALLAAKVGALSSVKYVGRKPPHGWTGSPADLKCDLTKLTKPFTHFAGAAREAATQYPKNANVAATIAIAGIGMDETKVELIADPDITKNTHEVQVSGEFGSFTMKIEGRPLPGNPKSSALAAMSIVQEIRQRISNVGF